MRPIKNALAGALSLLLACAPLAAAAADNMTVLDSAAATKTLRCVDVGSLILACTNTIADHLGNLIDPATSGLQTSANTKLDQLHTDMIAATPAGDLHTGEVGGNALPIVVPLTVTASSAYASGNSIGGLITISNAVRVSGTLGASGTTAMLQGITINFKSTQSAEVDVVVFKANPTGSTCTDKTAFALAVADFDKVIDVFPVTTYANSLGTPSVASLRNIARVFGLSSSTTAYACAITRGTPTFTATSDPSIDFDLLRN